MLGTGRSAEPAGVDGRARRRRGRHRGRQCRSPRRELGTTGSADHQTVQRLGRTKDMGLLDDKVVLVTGGGRGIGRAHCLELAAQGAAVVVNDPGVNKDGQSATDATPPAEQVVQEIVARGGRAVAHVGSVASWDDAADMVDTAVRTFGALTGVVNNAGIVRDGMIAGAEEADWDAVLSVHLKGTFAVTRHACAHWRAVAKSGTSIDAHVVNTVSGAGLWGNVGQSAYGAAKAAIANLTVVTAMEMKRYG